MADKPFCGPPPLFSDGHSILMMASFTSLSGIGLTDEANHYIRIAILLFWQYCDLDDWESLQRWLWCSISVSHGSVSGCGSVFRTEQHRPACFFVF